MKKLSHNERIDKIRNNIKKIKQNKWISSKKIRYISLGSASLVVSASVIGLTVSLMHASQKSKLPSYYIEETSVDDFLSRDLNNKPEFDVVTNGATKIYYGHEGPVNFVSNYGLVYDDDKVGDLLSWFYHDVNWGPEVSSLIGVNLFSGIQKEPSGGIVNGYHTTSKEGSTIIMSPDVISARFADLHLAQSNIYALFNHLSDQDRLNVLDIFHEDDNEFVYRDVIDNDFFNETTLNLWNFKANEIFKNKTNGNFAENILDFKNQYLTQGTFQLKQEYLINNLSSPKLKIASKAALMDHLFAFDEAHLDSFVNYLSDDVFTILATNGQWVYGSDVAIDWFDDSLKKQTLLNSNLWNPHLSVLSNMLMYKDDPEKLKTVFEELLIQVGYNLSDQSFRTRVNGILNILHLTLSVNGILSNVVIDNQDFNTYLFEQTLKQMKVLDLQNRLDEITPDWLYEHIFTDHFLPDNAKDEFNLALKRRSDHSQIAVQLTQHLQNKYHPGEFVLNEQGQRIRKHQGVYVYKQGDDGFDSFIRRTMQDMSFIISHEYGHHFTLWWGSDLSGFHNSQQVSLPQELTHGATIHQGDVVINTEVLYQRSDSSLASARKYRLFKDVFSSQFQDDLDAASDGDTSTDLTALQYRSLTRMGNMGQHELLYYTNGIEGINRGFAFQALGANSDWSLFGSSSQVLGDIFQATSDIVHDSDEAHNLTAEDFNHDLGQELFNDAAEAIELRKGSNIDGANYSLILRERMSNIIQAEFENMETDDSGEVTLLEALAGNFDAFHINDDVRSYFDGSIAGFKAILAKINFNGTSLLSPRDIYIYTRAREILNYYGVLRSSTATEEFKILADLMSKFYFDEVTDKFASDNAFLDSYENWMYAFNWDGSSDFSTLYDRPENVDNQIIVVNENQNIIDNYYNRAIALLDGEYQDPSIIYNSGEILEKILLEIGRDTRELFDFIMENTTLIDQNESLASLWTLTEQISLVYRPLLMAIFAKEINRETGRFFETQRHFENTVNNAIRSFANDSGYFIPEVVNQKIITMLNNGSLFYDLASGVSGVDAVLYTFNQPGDRAKYDHIFSTVSGVGATPSSFRRYQTSFAESLTRSLNQVAFNIYPELLVEPGEYFADDALRFHSYGDNFYDLWGDSSTGQSTLEGRNLMEMWFKFIDGDKSLSTMIRRRTTGLYSFAGFTPVDQRISGIVFTDGDGEIMAQKNVEYGTDNYHFYQEHGNPESVSYLADIYHRESFMSDWMVLGSFTNSELLPGVYQVHFWTDSNEDGIVQSDELTALKNQDVPNGGIFNNNGKQDGTAEILGNPTHSDANGIFEVQIRDIKV